MATKGRQAGAARGARGQAEAGTDPLFRALHADHEQVAQLVEEMLRTDDEERTQRLWQRICVNLTAHARAEQETVYERLEDEQDTREQIGHSFEEHADIERLIAECDAQGAGSDEFYAMAAELEQVVRNHVTDEEGELLPLAREILDARERDRLVQRFKARKTELMPDIEEEFGVRAQPRQGAQRRRQPAQGAQRQQQGRSSQASERRRSASRSGSKSAGSRSSGGRGRTDDLSGKTVRELRQMASKQDIPGRSRMSKRELVNALRRA